MSSQTLPVRMEAELYERIKKAATEDHRSMANWCIVAVENEFKKRNEKKEK